MEGVVLHRVGILGPFFVLNRVSGTPIPRHRSRPSPPPPPCESCLINLGLHIVGRLAVSIKLHVALIFTPVVL